MKSAALILIMLASTCAALAATASDRDPSVDRLLEAYIAAWNRADARAIADQYTADGDFISPDGLYAGGRAQIEAFYAKAFSVGYAGSTAAFTQKILRHLDKNIVEVDGEWSISGAHQPDGSAAPVERGIAVAILVKSVGSWRVALLREQTSAPSIRR